MRERVSLDGECLHTALKRVIVRRQSAQSLVSLSARVAVSQSQ